jgi:hypothetical protein
MIDLVNKRDTQGERKGDITNTYAILLYVDRIFMLY